MCVWGGGGGGEGGGGYCTHLLLKFKINESQPVKFCNRAAITQDNYTK